MSPTAPRLRRPRLVIAAALAATTAGAFGSARAASITKPIPMALLAGEVAAGARRRPVVDTALLASALAFSAAGDRMMLLEEFTPTSVDDRRNHLPMSHPLTHKDSRLAAGAALFAGAQACYCALLWRRGARLHARATLLRMAALGESAAVIATHRPRLLAILGPYGNLLATMSALAADAPDEPSRVRVGGLLFLASDLTIINRRHLITNPTARRVAETWVLASYFAAQSLLVEALAS